MGNDLMLAGLAFQVFTLAVFAILCLAFMIRASKFPERLNPTYENFRAGSQFNGFLVAVFVTFIAIFTRCVYRVVELGGGWNNHLQREEIPFIILESW
jgi:hypothetical protein